jgi:hypothetical protein
MNDIFWIKGNPPAPLAIVLRPRGDEWLEDELLGMRRGGIQTLVSLLEEDEAVLLGLADEAPIAEHVGLKFLSYPIPDTEIPSNIGRATVTAACALIHLGWSPQAALAAIQAARGCMVPDTQEQEDWILRYKARP